MWDSEGCLDKVKLAVQAMRANDADTIHLEGDKLNKVDDRGVQELMESMRGNTCVTHLDLSLNAVTDAGAAAVAEMLAGNSTLLNLELDGNSLSNTGVSALCDALAHNQSLNRLDLSNNHRIDNEGAQRLASMLKLNTSLQFLHIRSCGVGTKGIAQLANMLCKNNSLQGLYLSGNIGDDGVVPAVCEMLRQNYSLTELGLANNELSEPGVMDLIGGLEENEYLQKFHLSASGGKRLKTTELDRLLKRNARSKAGRESDIQRAREEVRHEYESRIATLRQEHAGEVASLRREIDQLRRGM